MNRKVTAIILGMMIIACGCGAAEDHAVTARTEQAQAEAAQAQAEAEQTQAHKLIHFTVQDEDFPLPPSVFEYHISNPDVEHHNSYATFRINGQDIDCFTDFVTTEHFEEEGDSFFFSSTTALVPIDGSDLYYTPEQAENFDEVFGTNTEYVVDPEECLADNFGYALTYGMAGVNGKGYPNPEIIEGILNIISR